MNSFLTRFLAALLLLAVALKISLITTDPFADIQMGMPFFAVWLVIFIEIAVAIIGVSSKPHTAFLLMSVLWCGFLALAVFRLVTGQTNCGCFGVFEIPTSIMLFFNSIVLNLLWFTAGPTVRGEAFQLLRQMPSDFSTRHWATILGVALSVTLFWIIQQPSALAQIGLASPPSVSAAPVYVVNGNSDFTSFKAVIHNQSQLPTSVTGVQSSCSCVKTVGNKIHLPASEKVEVGFRVDFRGQQRGRIYQRSRLYLDHPLQNHVDIHILGRVE